MKWIEEEHRTHSAGAFYRFLAHLGFGLVTYLPPIFFTVDVFIIFIDITSPNKIFLISFERSRCN